MVNLPHAAFKVRVNVAVEEKSLVGQYKTSVRIVVEATTYSWVND